jgi:hypothetical protein
MYVCLTRNQACHDMPGQIGLGRRSRVRFGLHGAIAGMMMGEDKRRARSDGSLGPVDHVSLPL